MRFIWLCGTNYICDLSLSSFCGLNLVLMVFNVLLNVDKALLTFFAVLCKFGLFASPNKCVLFLQFTSLFIHWYPLLVVWTLQWYPRTGSSPDMTGNDASGVDLVLWPMLTYTFWAIFYYIKIFVISPGKIKEREYETLYQWMMSDPHGICPKLLSR